MSEIRIAALATCHNRKSKTLAALRALHAQRLPDGVEMSITMVDDGSTDGTAQAVVEEFPSVRVLSGDGSLFWAGGMRFGWEAVRHERWDFMLVFNDDVTLDQEAVGRLLSVVRCEPEGSPLAVAAAFRDPENGNIAYGAVVRSSAWHPLKFQWVAPACVPLECSTLNMNLALISLSALELVGFLSERFVHRGADYDFGLRLRRSGGKVLLAPGVAGECARNSVVGTSEEPGISYMERWRRLVSTKEQPPRERASYYREHAGWLWPLLWSLPYVKALLGIRRRYRRAVPRE